MKRYAFYLLIALVTFGFTSLATNYLLYIQNTPKESARFLTVIKNQKGKIKISSKNKPIGIGYGESTVKYSEWRKPKPVKVEQTEIVCTDLSILSIWKKVVKDKEFQDRIDEYDGIIDCEKVIEVKQVDLNNDGNPEFLVNGTGPRLCSATGSCGFWIFQKAGKKYKKLLSSTSYMGETYSPKYPMKSMRKNKYKNIFFRTHLTGFETNYRTYVFNGKKYIEKKCVVEQFFIDGEKEILSCKEWKKR